MKQDIRKKVESFAKTFKWTPKDYYWQHTLQTKDFALMLQKNVGGDEEVVELSALLHDIGKAKLLAPGHEKISAELSEEFLNKLNFPEGKVDRVVECILYEKFDLIEAQILRAADSMSLIMDSSGGKEWYFENVLGNNKEKIRNEIQNSYNEVPFDIGRKHIQEEYERLIKKYT